MTIPSELGGQLVHAYTIILKDVNKEIKYGETKTKPRGMSLYSYESL